MSKFKTWMTDKLGYEPRQIDLANELGFVRGELVRKWFAGQAYPNKENCAKLATFLKMGDNDVQKAVLQIRMDDLEG